MSAREMIAEKNRKAIAGLIVALAIAAALTVIPQITEPAHAYSLNDCGDNVYWAYDQDQKILTISGTGDMWNYGWREDASLTYDETPWARYNAEIKKIVVGEGVTSVGNFAFTGKSVYCSNVSEVVLPSTLQRIGSYAFDYVGSDESVQELKVTLPEGLTTMGDSAFAHSGIRSISIPSGIKILDRTFDGSKIEEVNLGSVEEISGFAFYQCENLKSINLPSTLRVIGAAAFSYTPLVEVVIPEGVTTIGYSDGDQSMPAFFQCGNLKKVVIPSTVTQITDMEFGACENIEEIGFTGTQEQWNDLTGKIGENSTLGEVINNSEVMYNFDPDAISIKNATVLLSASAFRYNAKIQKPSIRTIGGKTLRSGTDYTAKWSNASSKVVGTYTVTITGTGKYYGQTKATYRIVKAPNTLIVKGKTANISYAKLKKKTQTVPRARVIAISKPQGKLTYQKVRVGSKAMNQKYGKKITVNAKTGNVNVSKTLKKGTYKVTVRVIAAGNNNYGKVTKTMTIAIRVK